MVYGRRSVVLREGVDTVVEWLTRRSVVLREGVDTGGVVDETFCSFESGS